MMADTEPQNKTGFSGLSALNTDSSLTGETEDRVRQELAHFSALLTSFCAGE